MPDPFLQETLDLAKKGQGLTSPNPTVGAVVVQNGEIVGRGYHTWAGVDHAEIVALKEAGPRTDGATLYVSLEPCCHRGRTGPCTEAIIAARIARVVAPMEDPNPEVAGKGFDELRARGIDVVLDSSYAREAEALNISFVHFMRTGFPLVTVKAALTLDGKIAAPQDNFGWITSDVARANVQEVRHFSDAILTGLGTVVEDDCLLTDRSGKPRSRPLLRIVLDSQLRIPLTSKMVKSAKGDVLVVGTTAAPDERRKRLEDAGIRVLITDGPAGRTDPKQVLRFLARERYLSLMVEAGAKVNWTFLDGQIADKVLFYYAPKILGGMESLPVAGGAGRLRRSDAILLEQLRLLPISTNEFAVEAWLVKG